ncbi:PLP-dependent aminotransferase family protein [Arthrobacter sp. 92]|uniref:MocR-like pyridoxine biosynthesis transcription factor PdxR n=1 Tax=Arthrobacter sp. 92 TaxID=3418175 RepID=UPI003D048403
MAVDWSGSTPSFLLGLDRDKRGTLGDQLQEALRSAVRSGRLSPGERLPSSRSMSKELGVSRGLVQSSYEQLEAEGYLLARGGSATRVAFTPQSSDVEAGATPTAAAMTYDFSPGRPDLRSFPMRDWMWACGEVARSASAADMGYADPRGLVQLRDVVASYVRRVRGSAAGAANVVVCSGFTQGLSLTLAVLARRGMRRVAVEDPGHLEMAELIRRAGLEPVFVPVDVDGLVVDDLAATAASAVIVTPAHQTPTGVVLAPSRRQALLTWAKDCEGIVIEDDYDSEFRYDKKPVGSLQGLSADRVVSIGSVSKSLAPALRLGWVVAPGALAAEMAEEKYRADRGSPGLDQLVLARLMASGRFDRHLRRMRGVYAGRRAALVEALAAHSPGTPLTGLAAGFHAVAGLPPGTDEGAVIAAAAERSVGLQGLARYRSDPLSGPPGIVFGFGDLREASIRTGIAAIADLLN